MSPDISFPGVVIISAVGFSVGIFGAVMGSTLFILVPLLEAMGMPIHAAIGTSKVSVVGREIAPLIVFRSQGLLNLRAGIVLTLTAVVTAQLGAYYATVIEALTLERIVGVCMLLMLGFSMLNNSTGLKASEAHFTDNEGARNVFVGALIGFYTGIFGGGANVLIVFALVYISRHTFLSAVANSKLPNIVITAASLPVFVTAGYVHWQIALPLTLATATGASIGARLAINRNNRTFRALFRVLIMLLAMRYLF